MTRATCVVCLERSRPVPLPCCGVAGAEDQLCRECAAKTFDPVRPAKCPKCRAWLVGPPDRLVHAAAVLGGMPPEFVEHALLVARAIQEDGDVAGVEMARQIVRARRAREPDYDFGAAADQIAGAMAEMARLTARSARAPSRE